ncbi:MAG: hypothetical protein A3J79_14445 [Elusimicrobia bacterium RIFOXYB2_FULL_62_6]|nr:MAG: hypothetical protein A3J79_14445 [Elusimicrobia bacterium RIFOXYB2_FULL_62_6]
MEITAIGIMGADEAGAGIAETFVKNGYQVRLYDDFKDSLNVAMAKINWSLHKAGKQDLLANLEGIQDMSQFKGADIVIEALARDIDARRHSFSKLKEHLDPGCVVAAYCAVLPLKTLMESTDLPKDRTIGLHFVRPARSNPLVELVRLDHTGDAYIEAALALLRKIGKTPILVKDNPGQIVERLTRPFMLSALKMLGDGKGVPHEIDAAFREVAQAARGPFEMADNIGLDADYKAAQDIYEALGRPERLTPSALELRLVQYGQVGRKSTLGFYVYEDGQIVGENPILSNIIKYLGLKKVEKEEIFAELLRPMLEEAKLLAGEIMASEYDIETAVKLGLGWPKGVFAYSRDMEPLFARKSVSEFDKLDIF